jgi:hypothetical protein
MLIWYEIGIAKSYSAIALGLIRAIADFFRVIEKPNNGLKMPRLES